MTAGSVPEMPSQFISMYSGIMPSWTGTIIVTTTASSSVLRPRKRSLAKAKPASAENMTTEMVTVPATRKLLTRAWQNVHVGVGEQLAEVVPEVPAGRERRRRPRDLVVGARGHDHASSRAGTPTAMTGEHEDDVVQRVGAEERARALQRRRARLGASGAATGRVIPSPRSRRRIRTLTSDTTTMSRNIIQAIAAP